MRLAAQEYDRFTAMLRRLPAAAWELPTCNDGWDVTSMVRHTVGMTHLAASIREQLIQLRLANRRPGPQIDALTAVQIERNLHRGPQQLIERMAEIGPKAVAGRRRAPALIRNRVMPGDQPVSPQQSEPWTFGYLLDTILTRDTWMHRTDLAEATGVELELTADHDAVVVADVVADWASRHDDSYDLTLTGAAGGTWRRGTGGERIERDAVEFCRILSGRGSGEGLLRVRVPF
jgi:uncharacterized protein (TIGR03083 family)